MELAGKISLIVHVVAGALTLLAGPVAIFYNFNHARRHKLAGKVFFYAMMVVCFTAVAGYLKRPDQVFFQLLLGISIVVLAGVFRGVRFIRFMKGAKVGRFDYVYTVILALFGFSMLLRAIWLLQTSIPFAMLFGLFGLAALKDAYDNLNLFKKALQVEAMQWYRLHVVSMLGAFTAATTAFTVNTCDFLPWYLQWFGPTLLIVPVQIYFGRKLKHTGVPKRVLESGG